VQLIQTASGLDSICSRIRAAGVFGVDMEFQRETSYFAKLHLVQVATPLDGKIEIDLIDPLALSSLEPLFALVADASVETIVHAGGQDMEIVHQVSGAVPANIFDTQIAAGLAGYGEHPSYRTLVKSVLDVRVSKSESRTDWALRPLTDGQLAYARDDVIHLPPLRDRISARLHELGRADWAAEEMAHYAEPVTYNRDPSRLYLRMRRASTLDRRELAILRELCAWREGEAARRDRPRGRIVPDDVLVDVARRAPGKVEDLAVLRGLHPKDLERHGQGIVDTVARALEMPRSGWPAPVRDQRDGDVSTIVDLLDIVVRASSRESGVARAYLGTRQDLADLVEHLRGQREDPPALLTGWRRELVGKRLLEFTAGRAALALDPRDSRVHVVRGPEANDSG
jgi:ribonuclease D